MCFRLTLQWNRCDWSCIQPYISAMDKTSSNWGIREGWGAAEHHPNAGYRLLLDLSLLPVKVPSDSVKAEPQAAADCFGKQKGLEWKLVKKTWKETTQGFIEHSFKGKWFRLLVGVKENTNNWSWVFFSALFEVTFFFTHPRKIIIQFIPVAHLFYVSDAEKTEP